jgi:uncharacterized membrane protein
MDNKEKVFREINEVRDKVLNGDKEPLGIKILNSVLNWMWRWISCTGIIFMGVYVSVMVSAKMTYFLQYGWSGEFIYWFGAIAMIVTISVFAVKQLLSKDIIHITFERKDKKEKKDE